MLHIPQFILFYFFLIVFNTLFILFIYLFMTVLGLLVFVWGLSLVAASGGHSSSRCGGRSSSRCAGLSLSRPLPLRGTGSRCAGSVVVAHGPSCSVACGIFPDQGSNPCPLHWQADSQPLHHQGSPANFYVCRPKDGSQNTLLKEAMGFSICKSPRTKLNKDTVFKWEYKHFLQAQSKWRR